MEQSIFLTRAKCTGVGVLGLALGLAFPCTAPALAQTCDDMSVRAVDNSNSTGRAQLAQGIALYESKNLLLAERALQSALFTGLADRGEQASTHKYLAYIYCSRQEISRCEASFEAAFAARPAFSLQAFELQGTPWRDTYIRAQQRASTRCPVLQQTTETGVTSATGLIGGFPLHSSVIASVTPLAITSLSPLTPAPLIRTEAALIPSGHNIRIRVKPWAQVYLNGKQIGASPPLLSLRLDPGRHSVELRNPGFESHRQVIQLTEGSMLTITHDFDAQ